ncbi:hypothetical protein M405DRAFT_812757 [Rhizopogon salebrosus TDB-379]|nr:hypothetical protein M405DRAFT_812757 [Rhizopogon salebrosus TDB-379]
MMLVGTNRGGSGSPACRRFWDISLSCSSLVDSRRCHIGTFHGSNTAVSRLAQAERL